jgi:dolichyldiphosphatase
LVISGACGHCRLILLSRSAAKACKKLIQQPRPSNIKKLDEGMPSRHASTLYYFASYLTAHFLFSSSSYVVAGCAWLRVALVHILTFGMIAVRYTEEFHSIPQLIAGAVLGSAFGTTWYHLATSYIDPLVQEQLRPFLPS